MEKCRISRILLTLNALHLMVGAARTAIKSCNVATFARRNVIRGIWITKTTDANFSVKENAPMVTFVLKDCATRSALLAWSQLI